MKTIILNSKTIGKFKKQWFESTDTIAMYTGDTEKYKKGEDFIIKFNNGFLTSCKIN